MASARSRGTHPLRAFDRVASIEQLTLAWTRVQASGGTPGGDGETIADIAPHISLRLQRLAAELQAGFYRPGPLRTCDIAKETGGTRRLSIPCVIDRIAQRAAADVLQDLLEPHFEDSSFGYRPGRSHLEAVARVAALRREGYQWVVDGDIRAFFDEVPHDMVLARLGAHVPDNRMVQLVWLWLESFSSTGRGLAQGSPLSPILSNLHLDAIDEKMDGKATRLIRFADDFVILTKSEPKALAALDRMASLLAEHGLELNTSKTRIVDFDTAFKFLGHIIVRTLVQPAGDWREPVLESRSLSRFSITPQASAPQPRRDEPEPASTASFGLPSGFTIRRRRVSLRDLAPVDEASDDMFAVGLAPLYVLEAGRRLQTEGDAFSVTEDGRRLLTIPAHRVGRIDLGHLAEADDGALRLASAHRVPVHLLDAHGAVAAVVSPPSGPDSALHLGQARLMFDADRALGHARALVAGRIDNCRRLLMQLNRRRDPEAESAIRAACDRLDYAHRKAHHAATIDQARGIEGEAAARYWPALGHCLKRGWTLTTRQREGRKGEVAAVLDWTASLLARDVRAAIMRVGLHPGFGVLHTTQDGREACVYDLIEEFRAPIAEGLTVYLFNNRLLTEADFEAQGEQMRVVGEGGRKLIKAYESKLAATVRNPSTGRNSNWRGLVLLQARALAKSVRTVKPYTPYEMNSKRRSPTDE